MTIAVSSRKAKGRNFQKQVAERISDLLDIPYGKDELIASREMSQAGTDIRLIGRAKELFKYSCECKNQETWSLPKWIKQAKSNKEKGTDWLLFVKKNRHEPIVVMDMDTFFKMKSKINKEV